MTICMFFPICLRWVVLAQRPMSPRCTNCFPILYLKHLALAALITLPLFSCSSFPLVSLSIDAQRKVSSAPSPGDQYSLYCNTYNSRRVVIIFRYCLDMQSHQSSISNVFLFWTVVHRSAELTQRLDVTFQDTSSLGRSKKSRAPRQCRVTRDLQPLFIFPYGNAISLVKITSLLIRS